MNDKLRIAILGATGHIGRSLLHEYAKPGGPSVLAYARRPEALAADRRALGDAAFTALPIDDFGATSADVVINCVGAGDPARVRDLGAGLFALTADFDGRALDFLAAEPRRLYVNMSSGAVYGTDFQEPARRDSTIERSVNRIEPADFYGIVKRHAEARHRAHGGLNIVDIRVFNYVSRFLNREGRLFIVDLVNALLDGRELATMAENAIRDYATPRQLMAMIDGVIRRWQAAKGPVNAALDLYTDAPVAKFDLLTAAQQAFGLRWRITSNANVVAATGAKSVYYSENHAAADWGYRPDGRAIDGVMTTLSALKAARA